MHCVHLIFGALRSNFWWDVSTGLTHVARYRFFCNLCSCQYVVDFLCVKHALGTRLLQKCLRHSPPGVVCTQVWNLKELTEGHHKNAWSMWLNLTQRGKSYRVRTHWGLTGIINVFGFFWGWNIMLNMLVLSWLCDRWCMAVLSSWSDLSA